MPLFYWLLDVSLVNAYRLYEFYIPPNFKEAAHKHFRRCVAEHLVSTSYSQLHPPKLKGGKPPSSGNSPIVNTHSEPHPEAHCMQGNHVLTELPGRRLCWLCRYAKQQAVSSGTVTALDLRSSILDIR